MKREPVSNVNARRRVRYFPVSAYPVRRLELHSSLLLSGKLEAGKLGTWHYQKSTSRQEEASVSCLTFGVSASARVPCGKGEVGSRPRIMIIVDDD